MNPPNCYRCANRIPIPGDCHIGCGAVHAKVRGARTGIMRGWFAWPWNFDPTWLEKCDSFRPEESPVSVPVPLPEKKRDAR